MAKLVGDLVATKVKRGDLDNLLLKLDEMSIRWVSNSIPSKFNPLNQIGLQGLDSIYICVNRQRQLGCKRVREDQIKKVITNEEFLKFIEDEK